MNQFSLYSIVPDFAKCWLSWYSVKKNGIYFSYEVSVIKSIFVAIIVCLSTILASLLSSNSIPPEFLMWAMVIAGILNGIRNFLEVAVRENKPLK